jgi:hypothetical protein
MQRNLFKLMHAALTSAQAQLLITLLESSLKKRTEENTHTDNIRISVG